MATVLGSMATVLAPVGARDVVRCDLCRLTQFIPANRNCRRCHASLDEIIQPTAPEATPVLAHQMNCAPSAKLPAAVRTLRLRLGLSQRDLGTNMAVPRTYVSKIENDKATPNLPGLERLARGLRVTVAELLGGGERTRQDEVRELAADPFVNSLLPYLPHLGELQRRAILVEMNSLSLRRRAAAA